MDDAITVSLSIEFQRCTAWCTTRSEKKCCLITVENILDSDSDYSELPVADLGGGGGGRLSLSKQGGGSHQYGL